MNPSILLFQMLPILVFIIVDSVFNNTVVSIIAAIVCAAIQLTASYITTRQIDWFVVLDAALILAMGLISIMLKNEIFFKVKPAVIELIMVGFSLALVLAPDTFLASYFGRFMPGRPVNAAMIGMMKSMMLVVCIYTVVHIGAIIYTAFASSKRVWAIVSGPGYYFIFIPIMAVILFKAAKARRRTRTAPAVEDTHV